MRDIFESLQALSSDSSDQEFTGSTLEDLLATLHHRDNKGFKLVNIDVLAQMLTNYIFLTHTMFISEYELLRTLIKLYIFFSLIG